MKGYYCIYECSKNQWLFEDIFWKNDRDYYTMSIGTKHAIQMNQGYNYNPNQQQIEIIDTQSVSALTDTGNRVEPNSLMKFETMQMAEDFLLKTFSSDGTHFYSIRKIYF